MVIVNETYDYLENDIKGKQLNSNLFYLLANELRYVTYTLMVHDGQKINMSNITGY